MDRGLDQEADRRPMTVSPPVSTTERGDRRPRTASPRPFALPSGRRREPVDLRGRTYRLRDTEGRTLEAVGTFRVVFTRDLRTRVYDDDGGRLARDLDHLSASGLIERRPFGRHGHRREPLELVALTPTAQTLLNAHRTDALDLDGRQAVYAGFVRPAELLHDATLYRLYLTEVARLERTGAVVRRVVLDHQLKGDLHRLARVDGCAPAAARDAAVARAATLLELPMVDGHVQIPDLRLEIEDAAGARARVDLELATEAYRPGQLRAKARAGFAIYHAVGVGGGHAALVLRADAGRHARAGFDPDLASRLLSL